MDNFGYAAWAMGDAADRGWGPGWPNCNSGAQVTITITGGAAFPVRREIAELTRTLCETTVARGYPIRKADTWGYNCRPIGGTTTPSNHSWGLAVDINWQTNPHKSPLTTDMPDWMPTMWEACGFDWGGRWSTKPDAMHYEYMGTPSSVAHDLATARTYKDPGPPELEDDMPMYRYLRDKQAGHLLLSDKMSVRWLKTTWDNDDAREWLRRLGLSDQPIDVTRDSIRAGEFGVWIGPKPPW